MIFQPLLPGISSVMLEKWPMALFAVTNDVTAPAQLKAKADILDRRAAYRSNNRPNPLKEYVRGYVGECGNPNSFRIANIIA